jgi:hypothetical protein
MLLNFYELTYCRELIVNRYPLTTGYERAQISFVQNDNIARSKTISLLEEIDITLSFSSDSILKPYSEM